MTILGDLADHAVAFSGPLFSAPFLEAVFLADPRLTWGEEDFDPALARSWFACRAGDYREVLGLSESYEGEAIVFEVRPSYLHLLVRAEGRPSEMRLPEKALSESRAVFTVAWRLFRQHALRRLESRLLEGVALCEARTKKVRSILQEAVAIVVKGVQSLALREARQRSLICPDELSASILRSLIKTRAAPADWLSGFRAEWDEDAVLGPHEAQALFSSLNFLRSASATELADAYEDERQRTYRWSGKGDIGMVAETASSALPHQRGSEYGAILDVSCGTGRSLLDAAERSATLRLRSKTPRYSVVEWEGEFEDILLPDSFGIDEDEFAIDLARKRLAAAVSARCSPLAFRDNVVCADLAGTSPLNFFDCPPDIRLMLTRGTEPEWGDLLDCTGEGGTVLAIASSGVEVPSGVSVETKALPSGLSAFSLRRSSPPLAPMMLVPGVRCGTDAGARAPTFSALLTPNEAKLMIDGQPCREVMAPYLAAEDVLHHLKQSPGEWVILFGRLTEAQAEAFKGCYRWLKKRISSSAGEWWKTPGVERLSEVWPGQAKYLVVPLYGRFPVAAFVPGSRVVSSSIGVVVGGTMGHFACYQSVAYEVWWAAHSGLHQGAWKANQECFRFPFPENLQPLYHAGKVYSEVRDQYEQQFSVGLADLYRMMNARASGFERLAEVHEACSQAVLRHLGYPKRVVFDYTPVQNEICFTISGRGDLLTWLKSKQESWLAFSTAPAPTSP